MSQNKRGKSSVPCSNIVVNPFYGKAEALVSRSVQFRAIAQGIRIEAKGFRRSGVGAHNIDVAALLRSGKLDTLKASFMEQMQKVMNAEPPKPVLGPPPGAVEVYGRFGKGCKVTDIGSGNGLKLRKYVGTLTITAVEPTIEISASLCQVVKSSAGDYLPTVGPDCLLSSWMSLTQLTPEELELVQQHDGCHGIPDHGYLLALGAAHHHEGAIVVRTGNLEHPLYRDTPLLHLQGYSPEPGYLIVSTFAQRAITVEFNAHDTGDPAIIDGVPISITDVDWRDVGYKWDGAAYELELHEGSAWLTDRVGRCIKGQYHAPDVHHLCVQYEIMNTPGSASMATAVPIRILTLNGMIPPHSGDTLRLFCERVHISLLVHPPCQDLLGGVTVVQTAAPPPFGVGSPGILHGVLHPTDGIICRSGGRDFYCKTAWTVDITTDMVALIDARLASIGLRTEWVGQPVIARGALHEYSLEKQDGTVRFEYARPRHDKFKPTTLDTVQYLCSLDTLEEDAAREGRPITAVPVVPI